MTFLILPFAFLIRVSALAHKRLIQPAVYGNDLPRGLA